MNEPKFTPGPWLFSSYKSGNSVIVIDGKEFDVATVNYPNRDANAHLIAASPDLYEALDALKAELFLHAEGNYFRPLLDKAEIALAKARGEG